MRISDWSSDVCSSDLVKRARSGAHRGAGAKASYGPSGQALAESHIVRGNRTTAATNSCRHPRACPEGPFCRGTEPLQRGQEPVAGMDCRDKPGNDGLRKMLGRREIAMRDV